MQEAEARASRLEDQIRTLRDSQSQLLARSSTLESKIAESSTQQEQLASLYDEMARTRGDSTLAEVEQSVMLANQHLELTGNVQAALLALENAQSRLGNSEQSQAIGARRVILQDIEKLKALPEVDLTRAAARLDQIMSRVDRLPLLADANEQAASKAAPASASSSTSASTSAPATGSGGRSQPDTSGAQAGAQPQSAQGGAGADATASPTAPPAPESASTPASSTPAPASGSATSPAEESAPAAPAQPASSTAQSPAGATEEKSALQRLYASLVEGGTKSLDAVREEFRSLVTIRRIDKPDSLLLSPEQKQVARENLKLLLLNARLNLLNRHEELFRQDLSRVIE